MKDRRPGALWRAPRRPPVGRWGGDEYLLILPGTDRPRALEAGRRLVDHLTGIRFARGWTVGAAAFPADVGDVATLVRADDEALYRA